METFCWLPGCQLRTRFKPSYEVWKRETCARRTQRSRCFKPSYEVWKLIPDIGRELLPQASSLPMRYGNVKTRRGQALTHAASSLPMRYGNEGYPALAVELVPASSLPMRYGNVFCNISVMVAVMLQAFL